MERIAFTELSFGSDQEDDWGANVEEITGKDWCKPLQFSMSRLKQMQPNVCNMILQDAKSLKPPPNMSKFSRQRQLNQSKQHNSAKPTAAESHLKDGQPQSTLKTSAWGSNSSIPELLARQKTQSSTRPSSASRFPPRNKVDSTRKPCRPQSAQESVSAKKEDKDADFGITGSKKPVDFRPPASPCSITDVNGRSEVDARDTESLTHFVLEEVSDSQRHFLESSNVEEEGHSNPAEANQPEISEHSKNPLRASQDEDRPVPPPIPESIRFSLPNMHDGSDSDEEELDTARLLQQADEIVEKKIKDDKYALHSLEDVNATVPETEHQLFSNSHKESKDLIFSHPSSCPISHVALYNNVSSNMDHTENINNHRKAMHSPHVTWCESDSIRLFQSDSAGLLEERESPMLRPGTGRYGKSMSNGLDQSSGGSHGRLDTIASSNAFACDLNDESFISNIERSSQVKIDHGAKKTETFRNFTKVPGQDTKDGFLMPNDKPIQYKPLELSTSDSSNAYLATKQRPDSGKRDNENCRTGKDNGTSLTSKFNNQQSSSSGSLNNEKSSDLKSCLSKKPTSHSQNPNQEPSRVPVPTVTLAYGEDEETQVDEKTSVKKKSKRRKNFDDIETYISRLEKDAKGLESELVSDNDCVCGDISCHQLLNGGKSVVEKSNVPVVKTTKTIEFSEGEAKIETVSKNELIAQREAKPERPVSQMSQFRDVRPQRPLSGTQRKPLNSSLQTSQVKDTKLESHIKPKLEETPALKPSIIRKQRVIEEQNKRRISASQKVTSKGVKPINTSNVGNTSVLASDLESKWKVTDTVDDCSLSSKSYNDGGLAPPQQQPRASSDGEKNEENQQEEKWAAATDLLEEAKKMALASMIEAAKKPTSTKKLATKEDLSKEMSTGATTKARPFSAPLKIASTRTTVAAPSSNHAKHKYCQGHIAKTTSTTGIRRAQSARPNRFVNTLSSIRYQDDNSPEMHHAHRLQMKMASMGVEVEAKALERALFPPSGKSVYYDIPDSLPRNPTETLLPHYKHWLSEDYRRVKLLERKLAEDDRIKYLQRVAAEKKALAKEKKMKKKKKKEPKAADSTLPKE